MAAGDHAIRVYEGQVDRHRDNAREALQMAARRLASALENWDELSSVNVAAARHAVQNAAEGYAELQAHVALNDVRFLTARERTAAAIRAGEVSAAAKLMRERAEAATSGQWYATDDDVLTKGSVPHWAGACVTNASGADGQYIASMHPAVALAVADWLEAAAGCGCEPGDDHGDLAAAALAVARAYLGTEQEG